MWAERYSHLCESKFQEYSIQEICEFFYPQKPKAGFIPPWPPSVFRFWSGNLPRNIKGLKNAALQGFWAKDKHDSYKTNGSITIVLICILLPEKIQKPADPGLERRSSRISALWFCKKSEQAIWRLLRQGGTIGIKLVTLQMRTAGAPERFVSCWIILHKMLADISDFIKKKLHKIWRCKWFGVRKWIVQIVCYSQIIREPKRHLIAHQKE